MSEGTIWIKVNDITVSAIDTSGAGSFSRWYDNNGTWVEQAAQTTFDINNWNNIPAGLTGLGVNKHTFNEFFVLGDGRLVSVYADDQYISIAQAESAPVITSLPDIISEHSTYIGRFVIKQGVTNAVLVTNPFLIAPTFTTTADHGNLGGLTDDDHLQYCLLTGRNTNIIKIDQIDEFNATVGVTIDSVLLKDNEVTATNLIANTAVQTDSIIEKTGTAGVTIDGVLIKDNGLDGSGIILIDTINEHTGTAGVTIDGVLIKDNGLDGSGIILIDTINEHTATAGVTIDSVLIKDNEVTATNLIANTAVQTDSIIEKTGTAGVTIDSVLLKDNEVTATNLIANTAVSTDSIIEKTGAAGVTIEGVNIKDDSPIYNFNIPATGGVDKYVFSIGGVSKFEILEASASTSKLYTDDIVEITGNAGVTIEGVKIEDAVVSATDITLKTLGGSGHIYMHDNAGVPVFSYDDAADTFQFSDTLEITVGNTLKTNTIENYNAVEGINIEGSKFLTNNVNIQGTLLSDIINEHTPTAGVTIDSVLIKDGRVTNSSTAAPTTDPELANKKYVDDQVAIENIWDRAGNNITPSSVNGIIKIDYIYEETTDAGVTIEGVLLKSDDITAENASITTLLSVNGIGEYTDGVGVTIDSVLIKDNEVTATNVICNTSIQTDSIIEKTGAAGVTIDGCILKDSTITLNPTADDHGLIIQGNSAGDAIISLNKDATGDKGSLIFQDAGDDKFTIRLYTNGNLQIYNTPLTSACFVCDITNNTIKMLPTYTHTVSSNVRNLFMDDAGIIGAISSTRESKMSISQMVSSEWLYRVPIKEYQYRATETKDGIKKYLNKPVTKEVHIGPMAEEINRLVLMIEHSYILIHSRFKNITKKSIY